MEQSTGGHYLDTGDGPTAVEDGATAERGLTGRGVETPHDAAWRAYVQHAHLHCTQCRTSVFRCADGDELWSTYMAAR